MRSRLVFNVIKEPTDSCVAGGFPFNPWDFQRALSLCEGNK